MVVKRRKFQGVLNILSFNRHFYVIGLSLWIITISFLNFLNIPPLWSWLSSTLFFYGLLMPLIISAYIYDFSGYYKMEWLNDLIPSTENHMQLVNINAGFDETSFIIKQKYPLYTLQVFDFYNAQQHTEPAIVRARKVSAVYPNTKQIATNKIPLDNQSSDVVFLLSAAHEIREYKEKVAFLKECRRVCQPNGKVITVEHLRDFPNYLAFSIGFTHFYSKNTWKKAFKEAGFTSFEEKKFTPFMSVFSCQP